ncbi:MAG: O-methyltransferase [Longimicrobiales bacterium]
MTGVDRYVRELFAEEDDALIGIRAAADEAGLPQIQIPAETGKALAVLIRLCGARRVLEIGTLGGYSAVWIARALPPGGSLTSLEIDSHHAEVARRGAEAGGVLDRVEVIVGDARETLKSLTPPFDVVFIDADKESYLDYLDEAARLLRTGGLLAVDNALWRGEVVAPEEGSLGEQLDRFNRTLASDERFEATILPVGDGVAVGVRLDG